MFLATVTILMGADLASADQLERICENNPDGSRHCFVKPIGGDPGRGPGVPGRGPGSDPGRPGWDHGYGHGPGPGDHHGGWNPPGGYPPGYPPPPPSGGGWYPPGGGVVPPPGGGVPPAPWWGPALDQFRRAEQDVLRWDAEVSRTQWGSWEQKYAVDQRTRSINEALRIVEGPQALSGTRSDELESFALDMGSKLSRASWGTPLFDFYSRVKKDAWTGFLVALDFDIQGLKWNWRTVLSLSEELQAKLSRMSWGTVEFDSYTQARDKALNGLIDGVQMEAQNLRSFRQIEGIALEFNQRLTTVSWGTRQFDVFSRIRTDMFARARAQFDQEVNFMYPQQIFQLQQEYDQRLSRASWGTPEFDYLRSIRDAARARLGTRP